MKLTVNLAALAAAASMCFAVAACEQASAPKSTEFVYGKPLNATQAAEFALKGKSSSKTTGGSTGTNCLEYDGTDCKECTRTHGYWKNHTEKWPCWMPPETPICEAVGVTMIQGMTTPPNGNAFWILSQQWTAALLNKVAMCGDIPAHIQAAIDEAAWFFIHRNPSDPMTDAERARAIELAGILDSFNNGHEGPPHCN